MQSVWGIFGPKHSRTSFFFLILAPKTQSFLFFFCISLPFQRETRGTVSPRQLSCEKAAAQEAAGLLLQLLHLTFLPRRGRCLVSVSCDQAVTSRYPARRQLSGLGCARLYLQQTVAALCRARFSGRKRPQCLPRERRLQTLPGSGGQLQALQAATARSHPSQQSLGVCTRRSQHGASSAVPRCGPRGPPAPLLRAPCDFSHQQLSPRLKSEPGAALLSRFSGGNAAQSFLL